MFYYKYHETTCSILAKSDTTFSEDSLQCHSEMDFNLEDYDIIVGYVNNNGLLLRFTKFEREGFAIKKLNERIEKTEFEVVDNDFRLCMLELNTLPA